MTGYTIQLINNEKDIFNIEINEKSKHELKKILIDGPSNDFNIKDDDIIILATKDKNHVNDAIKKPNEKNVKQKPAPKQSFYSLSRPTTKRERSLAKSTLKPRRRQADKIIGRATVI